MYKIGFDNQKYIETQSARIVERIKQFDGKLYLEFGGKLFDDYHAARVLPGFAPDSKIKMLTQLKDQAEIVIVINANDIEKNKVRGDLGITYDLDVLRLIDNFRTLELYVGSVVLTLWQDQPAAVKFVDKLENLGMKVYKHYAIKGYPADVDTIVSPEGYGRNEYIETTKPLVVITAPGPGSGKMATCLSQMYHDNVRGIRSGYAKFETFPIWNLELNHPVNVAYEAATVDLNDRNMIDPYHLAAYNQVCVNYNRDIENFPVLNAILNKIWGGKSVYQSPTDMGVNMAGKCIIDDEAVKSAANREILRRYYTACSDQRKGISDGKTIDLLKLLMQKAGIDDNTRPVIQKARDKAALTSKPACAIELHDGTIVTGKTSNLLGATSATIINALKTLAGIDDRIDLIQREILEPITLLKTKSLGSSNPRLHPSELLIALAICAVTDENAKKAMEKLPELKYCDLHSSVILSENDEHTLKKLGIYLTTEAVYESKRLYHGI